MITVYSLSAFRPEIKGLIRDIRAVWALEELGLTYTRKILDPKTREHKQPAFLSLNPFGKVPAITDDGFTLYESFAICTYLADKVGMLIPKPLTPERAIYNQWSAFAVSTLEPVAARVVNFDYFTAKDATTEKLRKDTVDIVDGFFKVLNTELTQRPFILGESFSVADILLCSVCRYVGHTPLAERHPTLHAYLESAFRRPAFLRAFENNG